MSKKSNDHLASIRESFYAIVTCGFVMFLLVFLTVSASAREIAGVQVIESMVLADGKKIHLNGAGIRSKFFFKIYVGALYMENPSREIRAIIKDTGAKRMVMHFLYDEVSKEKLVDGWNEGFEKNVTTEREKVLRDRINQFNDLFSTVKEGDVIILDYQRDRGTEVIVRGEKIGAIEGKDFNNALLLIWLGEEPVTEDLKTALLDYTRKQ